MPALLDLLSTHLVASFIRPEAVIMRSHRVSISDAGQKELISLELKDLKEADIFWCYLIWRANFLKRDETEQAQRNGTSAEYASFLPTHNTVISALQQCLPEPAPLREIAAKA